MSQPNGWGRVELKLVRGESYTNGNQTPQNPAFYSRKQ